MEYDTVNKAIDGKKKVKSYFFVGICDIYEQKRKAQEAEGKDVVEYTLDNMYEFLDKLHDIGILVLN